MLGRKKPNSEVRVELMTWGVILIVVSVIYVLFRHLGSLAVSMMLFFPGLILLGSAIVQDIRVGWGSSWFTYLLAILLIATGLAGLINHLMGDVLRIPWFIIALFELGAVLVAKALYDPDPRVER
ncbi:MAG TPA: hypothetical protein VKY39_10570 [Aggregatilineales bacterium]|jgi:hypothetical protein|nr:hypothetical protein [Aggregatilineales bacterium]